MDENAVKDFVELWKNRNIDYDTQTLTSKVDTLRFCIPQLSILKETNRNFNDHWSLDSEILGTQQLYAHLMDDKNCINNYADDILSLNKGLKNESKNWKCSLNAEDLKSFITHEIPGDSKFNEECAKLASLIRSTEPEKSEASTFQSQDLKDNSEVVLDFDIFSDSSMFAVEESSPSLKEISKNVPFNQGHSRETFQNDFYDSENHDDLVSKSTLQRSGSSSLLSLQQLQSQNSSFHFGSKNRRQKDKQKKYPWEKLRTNEEEIAKCPSFRTASHQLELENLKKFGAGRGAAAKVQYGNQKRSLGSRGIKSRFVPPVRKDDESEDPSSSLGETSCNPYAELMLDDRLRNIDAKMVELIMNEIMDHGTPVTWDDIAGLELAKTTIQEIVVWPMLRPDIFTGLRGPPKGILLFGPPGTGKTMIGKCIASQSRSTFFSISASSLTSKWIGEGEKMVRAMFAVAKCHQPAVIFIDEIDSLLTQRSDTEHESSRRLKTEFLVQLDGATSGDDERILVVGATNRPQELDEAARRRLVKRLYIPLPNAVARQQIIKNLLTNQNHDMCEEDIKSISEKADGYSGADMANLCREAALGPIRSIKFTDIQHISVDQVRPISINDFTAALKAIRASVSNQDLNLYEEWNKKYGINT